MIVTILASVLILFFILIIFYGRGFLLKPSKEIDFIENEKCEICRNQFDKTKMITREIGDFKLIYFCSDCVKGLEKDLAN